jgi:hypothetical protein
MGYVLAYVRYVKAKSSLRVQVLYVRRSTSSVRCGSPGGTQSRFGWLSVYVLYVRTNACTYEYVQYCTLLLYCTTSSYSTSLEK